MSDIAVQSVLAQIRTLRAEAAGALGGPGVMGGPLGTVGQPNGPRPAQEFSGVLSTALRGVNELQTDSTRIAEAFERGDKSVNLSDVMVSLNKANIAFQATVQVRNRFVQAYQEIMSMPI